MRNKLLRIAVLAVLTGGGLAAPSFAGTIKMAWDSVPGATGYRAYFGTSSGQYTGTQDMGGGTSGTLTGLADCTTYFVAIKAYDQAGGLSGEFSNEVQGWAAPEIHPATTPPSFEQGDQLTLDVLGANFDSGAQVTASIDGVPVDANNNDLVIIDDLTVISCNQLQALVTIAPSARGLRAMQIGGFDIDFEVVNPDTVFGEGQEMVLVEFDETRADINRDESITRDRVDGLDLNWLGSAFGSTEVDPRWIAEADMDGNGLVDGDDLVMLVDRFGGCWNGSGWSEGACN